jgi:hypothetical protein
LDDRHSSGDYSQVAAHTRFSRAHPSNDYQFEFATPTVFGCDDFVTRSAAELALRSAISRAQRAESEIRPPLKHLFLKFPPQKHSFDQKMLRHWSPWRAAPPVLVRTQLFPEVCNGSSRSGNRGGVEAGETAGGEGPG